MSEVNNTVAVLFSYKTTLVETLLELGTYRLLLPSETQCTDFEVFDDDIEYFKATIDKLQLELKKFKAKKSMKRKSDDNPILSLDKQVRAEKPLDIGTIQQNSVNKVNVVSSSAAVVGNTDNEQPGTSRRSSGPTEIAREDKKSPDEAQAMVHKCGKCNAHYGSKDDLTRHEEKLHLIFRCLFCDTVFRHNSARMRHLTSHIENRIYICGFCPVQCFDKANFLNHLKKHNREQNYEAELQKIKDADEHDLVWKSIKKIDVTASSVLFLGDLDESITREDLVSEFQSFGKILLTHLYSLPEAPGMKLGFIQFETKEIGCQVRRHKNGQEFMGRKLLISYCKSDKPVLNTMNVSQKGGSTVYECSICCLSDKPYVLKKHFQMHTGYKPFKCDLCGKDFPLNAVLLQHKRGKHKVSG